MSRWTPNARGRLSQAAFELFLERGYERTTVADIAEHAGLTERTFFRHFADKREALFDGSATLEHAFVEAVQTAPKDVSPLAAVRLAVAAAARIFHGRREHARARERIVSAHADLQERGLIKRATLTQALAEALRQREIPKPVAMIAADMGLAIFYIGFSRWIDDDEDREFEEIIHEEFERLKSIAAS